MTEPAEIVNPGNGTWQLAGRDGRIVDQGNVWHCRYCPHQLSCLALGPGRIKIEGPVPVGVDRAVAEYALDGAQATTEPSSVTPLRLVRS